MNYIYDNIQNINNNGDSLTLCGKLDLLISGFHIWDSPDPYSWDLQDRCNDFKDQDHFLMQMLLI